MGSLAFKVKRGETRRWTLTLTQDDGVTPLAGVFTNPRSEWRSGKTDVDPVVVVFGTETSCTLAGTISADSNVITMVLDNSVSKLMTPGKLYFDVFVDLDGEPFCVSGDQPGLVTITQNVTVPE